MNELSMSLPFCKKSLRHLWPPVVRYPHTPSAACAIPWCGAIRAPPAPSMCQSIGQHRHLGASDVREGQAPKLILGPRWFLECFFALFPVADFGVLFFSFLGVFLVEVGGGDNSKSVNQSPWPSFKVAVSDGMNVSIQNYSKHHIDSMVKLENNKIIRVMGFYGHANPNLRRSSGDILRRVGESVREEWIVGGDFNAILNDAEKEGGRRGVRAQMNEFKEVMDELALVDIKPDSDLWGRKQKDYPNDKRLCFKFDVCWAGDVEAKNVIERAWNRDATDFGEKIERVRSALGPWQRKKYGNLKRDMQKLEKHIDWIIDSGSADVAFRTPPAPYEKSKSLGSGGSMVARLKLKGIDGRAPPGVEPAA
ncbi:hypothetical protein GOBAR_AA38639 [Gossypium barbadense]|uniref:Endonuclease/exonuclease/phosphatase domain-containing protein n=1 Tax=Gossypium barbadense TaxID=3634 RepID=A0A2P5VTB4_GOSBA|nr:hypothetical protein GOBAR_AA38639 [Gossypium barbadense]